MNVQSTHRAMKLAALKLMTLVLIGCNSSITEPVQHVPPFPPTADTTQIPIVHVYGTIAAKFDTAAVYPVGAMLYIQADTLKLSSQITDGASEKVSYKAFQMLSSFGYGASWSRRDGEARFVNVTELKVFIVSQRVRK